MVGAGLESGCWMVWEMVEWRLVASVSELESGCIVAELALRVPKGGRMSILNGVASPFSANASIPSNSAFAS